MFPSLCGTQKTGGLLEALSWPVRLWAGGFRRRLYDSGDVLAFRRVHSHLERPAARRLGSSRPVTLWPGLGQYRIYDLPIGRKEASLSTITWRRHSRRIDPMSCST